VSTEAQARRPGRPRSAKAHRAILDAALALLFEHGYHGLSVEAVAARAGVGKTTIYRRWPSKQELVIEALRQVTPPDVPEDTGSLQGDLIAFQQAQLARVVHTPVPRLLPRLLGDASRDPDLHDAVVADVVGPIRRTLREILRRGVERGEIRQDLDLDFAVDVLHGTIIYRLLLSGDLPSAASAMPQLLELLKAPGSA
jgi:AcrR family transcriptional regulator